MGFNDVVDHLSGTVAQALALTEGVETKASRRFRTIVVNLSTYLVELSSNPGPDVYIQIAEAIGIAGELIKPLKNSPVLQGQKRDTLAANLWECQQNWRAALKSKLWSN